MSARSLLLALSLAAAALATSRAASAATRYVFATFLGDDASKEKLSLYSSKNGLDFTLLSNTGYAGPTGVLRDPSIMKHTDGKYYVAYTLKSWTTTSAAFAIAQSSDLKTWTFHTEVPAQVTGVKDTWAPEWFKDTDGSVHLIVSIDTSSTQFKSYLYTASDDTLGQWNAPTPLGIGPNYIDTFVVKVGAAYHAFSKNETSKFIEHATASALTGPWTFTGKGDWAGWGSGKEGPALFQLDSGQWRLLMDCYGNCGFLQATSTDLNNWSGTSTLPGGLSGVVRHGTVLREDDAALGNGGASGSGGANAGAAGGAGASAAGSLGVAGTSNSGGTGNAGAAFDTAGGAGALAVAGTSNLAGSAGSLSAAEWSSRHSGRQRPFRQHRLWRQYVRHGQRGLQLLATACEQTAARGAGAPDRAQHGAASPPRVLTLGVGGRGCRAPLEWGNQKRERVAEARTVIFKPDSAGKWACRLLSGPRGFQCRALPAPLLVCVASVRTLSHICRNAQAGSAGTFVHGFAAAAFGDWLRRGQPRGQNARRRTRRGGFEFGFRFRLCGLQSRCRFGFAGQRWLGRHLVAAFARAHSPTLQCRVRELGARAARQQRCHRG